MSARGHVHAGPTAGIFLEMRLGFGYNQSQVSCRGNGAEMERLSQFLQTWVALGPVGWARDRPTMVTLNLFAFVGLSQSLNDI